MGAGGSFPGGGVTSHAGADGRPGRPPLARLGHTGLEVSALGLGLAGLGRPAYMTFGRDEILGENRSVAAMRRRCHALLDAADAAGVTYIDTARSYGLAEAFLRDWLDHRPASREIIVGSKWGYRYTGGWRVDGSAHEEKSLALPTLRQQYAETRLVLARYLRIYQIHSATVSSGVLDDRRVLDELGRLRQRDMSIGVTTTGIHQADTIRRALAISVDGVPLFDTVQATWNLLEPSAGPALAEARAQGRGVIIKEVLANGRLSRYYEGPEIAPLRCHAAEAKVPLETLAVAAAAAQPWTTMVLSGALSCAQLRNHLEAFDVPYGLIPQPLAEPPLQYWRTRATIPWT
jgi:aryl-alcohol dehydrogenase-like predicted oxidoreductase